MATDYWGNFTGAWGSAGLAFPQQNGVAFSLHSDFTAQSLGWYRAVLGAGGKPDSLRLWQTGNSTPLAVLSTLTDDGAVGWQWTALPTPLSLVSGQSYIVTSYYPTGNPAYYSGDGPPSVPSPFVKVANSGRYIGNTNYPDNTTSSYAWGASVSDSTTGGGNGSTEPPAPDPDLGTYAALQQWLQDGYYLLREDSLPKINKELLLILQAGMDEGLGMLSALVSLGVSLKSGEPEQIAAAVKLVLDEAWLEDRWPGPHLTRTGAPGTGGAAGTVSDDVINALSPLLVDPNNVTLREWLTLSPDFSDTTRWSLNLLEMGTGDGVVNAGADAYLVSIVTAPPLHPAHTLPGPVTWLPRLGWAVPTRNGGAFPRTFLEFGDTVVHAHGLYMGGLTLYLPPGTDWQVQAMLLDRA